MNEIKLTDPYIGILYQLVDEELRRQEKLAIDDYNTHSQHNPYYINKLGELFFLKDYLFDKLNNI
jgi:hypothetical protein